MGFVPAVLCLLRHGASTNVHDRAARTPLLLACRHGHRQVAAELLSAGAYPNDSRCAALVSCAVVSTYTRVRFPLRSPMVAAIDREDGALAGMLASAGAHIPATHAARGLLLCTAP